jgi:hypothetical protein
MRTTLEIDDDVLTEVKEYATARSISNGAAATLMIKRGLKAVVPTKWENGILIFSPGPEGSVTAEHVQDLIDEMEGELP